MARDRKSIDAIRNNIASIVYNDYIPTSLITTSLKDICFQYDNYMKALAESEDGGDIKKQEGALRSIKSSIDSINRQNKSTGKPYDILYPKDNSPEAIRDIAETISIIYAIPYKADAVIDYVGYAYGLSEVKQESGSIYDTFAPDEYMNQCSIAVLDSATQREAEDIMQKLIDCKDADNYYKAVDRQLVVGSREKAMNLIGYRLQCIDNEVENVCGVKPQYSAEPLIREHIADAIKRTVDYSKIGAVDNIREQKMSYATPTNDYCME